MTYIDATITALKIERLKVQARLDAIDLALENLLLVYPLPSVEDTSRRRKRRVRVKA